MEILILVLLYYLSQNPDFSDSVRPLMEKLKNSEQMLTFLKDLSNFTKTFSGFQCAEKRETPCQTNNEKEKPQSPTEGIADEFIQSILDSYLKKS